MKWLRWMKGTRNNAETDVVQTYRERVTTFWSWWTEASDRIYQSLDEDGGRTIQPEISEQVNQLCPRLAWVFGPGEDGHGHSFTLSPEANSTLKFLAYHWHKAAPTLPNWIFYRSRQAAADFGTTSIRLGDDVEVSAASLWITPATDIENEEVAITIWSPAFANLDKDSAMRVVFIYLDEALGEAGTSRWIGRISLSDDELTEAIPLTELPSHIDQLVHEQGWKIHDFPATVYELKEPLGDFPRGDIFVGNSMNMEVVDGYFKAGGPFENPIPGCGVEFVFLQFPRALFPEGEEVRFRGEIEDALEEAFDTHLGALLGGATGTDATYIDLILFDGIRSHQCIEDVLKGRELLDQVQVLSFVT